ncbi:MULTISPECIES: TetR/AcrR family transcriptional regulator [Subtercola]|uniref:TetR/AcrR family transcriptional regulator n=1 Tax=Subtercola vilae TaxID=2056433 RepID=A0A4V4RHH6_9MICO|nr:MULTISPECIES: TetR/AcrR family transcriptional regulator [Subtercola]MEA9986414.1 TetR/AcrR family transcriptional regulator [Subtercola sp. RTI3]TIH40344.1 TetR/AcrR family transcriptional regulator [Subtercola vilae]
MTQTDDHPATRMRAAERRELVLDAAMQVFGDYGYVGSTTAQVARAAGVSQPYVVRMFGTKEQLFLDVITRALERLLTSFRQAVADTASAEPLTQRLGSAYVNQLRDRGLLLSLMHAFVLGKDPVIGPAGRGGFMQVYRFLRDEAGFGAAEAQGFLAEGMLINTMIGLRMTDEFDGDPEVRELLECAFPTKIDLVRSLAQ